MNSKLTLLNRSINETLNIEIKADEASDLASYFKRTHIKKGDTLLKLNQICRHYFYVETGALRVYFIEDGQEFTSWFAFENYFFTELESYLTTSPTKYEIVAIEACHVLEISKHNMENLLIKYKWWQDFFVATQQQTILKLIETIKSFQTLSATDRYNDLFKHPEFLQRITQKDLSTMLGVTRYSLSRIRKNKS